MSMTAGHLVLNLQPEGRFTELGMLPERGVRVLMFSGSGIGTASRSALVYGCRGFSNKLTGTAVLDYLSEIHHGDTIAHVAHYAEIMRHEKIGQVELCLQIFQQVQHLRPN